MSPGGQVLYLQGGAGRIEAVLESAARDAGAGAAAARGLAVIAHPHPLFAGTMNNKVVQTLARAFTQAGWDALRFNFRGVGASEGSHDDGAGESEDLATIVRELRQRTQAPALALGGFSFGAYVTLRALAQEPALSDVTHLVLVGTATSRFSVPPLADALHPRALVVHGEDDDVVPLAATLDWARPQSLPITVVPHAGHFFHGKLPLLKGLVLRHLAA